MGNINFLHGGNIYNHKKDISDFSASINPLGLPFGIKREIFRKFDTVCHYPDPDNREIIKKIAKYWKIKEENILIGNGSAELIYLIMATFRPKTTLLPTPTFSEYERAARNVGSRVGSCKSPDMAFLCNPNNPTGELAARGRVSGKLTVVDEAFMDFVPEERKHTYVWEAQKNRKIIVLRTFTKFFAMPGLRIGYLIAHKDTVRRLRQNQPPWSANILAQIAAKAALDNRGYIRKTRTFIEKERRFLFNELGKIKGLKPYPSAANFLLIKAVKPMPGSKFLQKSLLKRGILIRDCSNFRGLGNKHIRVAVRTRKENMKLIKALKCRI